MIEIAVKKTELIQLILTHFWAEWWPIKGNKKIDGTIIKIRCFYSPIEKKKLCINQKNTATLLISTLIKSGFATKENSSACLSILNVSGTMILNGL